jgi:hypothetical protein
VGIVSTVVGDTAATPVRPVRDTGRRSTENEEDTVAERTRRIDPAWPDLPDGAHPVTELASPVQGSLSPFGDVEFPLEEVPYVHPVTEINK